MNSDDSSATNVTRLLDAALCEVNEEAKAGRYNTMCIRALANAAAVLGQNEIAGRAVQLLRAAPPDAFWAGMITNFELPKVVPERMRSLDSPEGLAKHH